VTQSCAPLETPLGRLWVTVSPVGLVEIARGNQPPSGATVDLEAATGVIRQLQAYFGGRLRSFETPLDLSGATAFDTTVWAAAQTIPYGETASYGELAIMAGHPGAARAVGGSMSRCPFSPVVPCHRVIHADGSIGGWGSATWVKRWLLDLEGAPASARGPDWGTRPALERSEFTRGNQ
jgi:methylated-DNA-[protein]-cysteine S-methyltransferase